MKKFAKNIVVMILGWQVRRLRLKNSFKIVAVVGSIGKTSTKFAVANILKESKLVRFQEGNYNDLVSVPLVFFGQSMPNLINVFAWLRIFWRNEKQLKKPYHYDVVVIEIGTDGPGQIAGFSRYLHCDFTIVTAITPEHMEFFAKLDAVADEELSVADYSDTLIVNKDLCPQKYLSKISKKVITYGTQNADYLITSVKTTKNGSKYKIEYDNEELLLSQNALSLAEIYSACAGVIVGLNLKSTAKQVHHAVSKLQPVSGRMQRLEGIKNSLILDDTYNASPVAVKAALDIVYTMKAPQKIAVLGNMNEMGEHSAKAHTEIGEYCEPAQLDLVVTIGPDANKYLAKQAEKQGCKVQSFDNPYDAAEYIRDNIQPKALILAKGSQNGVFAEETVKLLLKNPNDADKLVRQSKYWLNVKKKNFSKIKI